MSTSQRDKCFDKLILRRLLSEQLQGSEEAAVLSHIEICSDCRSVMEQMTGAQDLREEIEQHLADHPVDDPGAATEVESPGLHSDILQIQGLLGATDDPQMLGRLGPYEIAGIVGRGSTGVVFKALDRRLNRYVAIKMLLPAYSGNGPARGRFEREGRSIASVRDEHVIPVFAVDEHQGLPFIVMEYMPAGSLEQRIEEKGTLDTQEVVRIGMQIAQALAAAHKQGIVHRDVKPANVLLATGIERALVTDFGLARILDEASMTRSGAISGTPQFMSPEQARGETVDHRSDLFSLGSVMYAAATGHSPFRSETVFGVIKRVCESTARPIRETNPAIKGWLCDFIERLHSKDPAHRFQTAQQVSDLLSEELAYLQSPAIVTRPIRNWRTKSVPGGWRSRAASVVTAVACVGLVAAFVTHRESTGPSFGVASEVKSENETKTVFRRMLKYDMHRSVSPEKSNASQEIADDFKRGMKLHAAEDFDGAILAFQTAIERGDRIAAAKYNIGCALALQGQHSEALDSLEGAYQDGFRDLDQYLTDADLKSVRSHERMQRLIETMATERRIARSLARGTVLRRQERYAEAEQMFRTVLELDPQHRKAMQELGLSLHLQGQLDEAIVYHRKVARIREFARLGNYNIGCYHALNAEPNEAFQYLQTAIDLGFDDIGHIETDPDLDSLRFDPRYERLLQSVESGLRKEEWTEHERQCHELLDAIRLNRISKLESLLEYVDPNCSCPDYRAPFGVGSEARQSPLTYAARLGRRQAANVLLFQGADVNRTPKGGPTPLIAAAAAGHQDVVSMFLEAEADVNARTANAGTALTMASQGGHVIVAEKLLQAGADINVSVKGIGTPLICALGAGHDKVIELLLKHKARVDRNVPGVGTALSTAVQTGRKKHLSTLLKLGADLNEATDGVGTAVIVAVRAGQIETFDWLVSNGADLDQAVDNVGNALTVASRDDRLRFLQKLVKHGADLDLACRGIGTPLTVAVRNGESQAALYLLGQGADPNLWVDGVYPPLAAAVRNDDRDLVRVLLSRGACADLETPGIESPVSLADEQENRVILELLVDSRQKQ